MWNEAHANEIGQLINKRKETQMKKIIILSILVFSVSVISAQGKACCKKGDSDNSKCQMSTSIKAENKNNVDIDIVKTGCPRKGGKESHQDYGISKNEVIEEKIAYYTCPMESHKNIKSAEPGKCPECGMKLQPIKLM